MRITGWKKSFAITALLVCGSAAHHAMAAPPGYRAGQLSAAQVLMLPKFCWWEFDARYAQTSQLIQNCGPMMNHYCSGEMYFIQSKDLSKRESERLGLLGRALTDAEYTLKGMQAYPACSIRGHVTRKYNEMRGAYIRYGRPMPPSILSRPTK